MPDNDMKSAVDQALEDLAEGERTWAELSLIERRDLLDQVHSLTRRHAAEWVDAAARIKRLDPESPLVGEEWLSGPYPLLTATAALSASLQRLAEGRSPLADAEFGTVQSGHTTITVLPSRPFDRLLLSGFSAEVWLQRGIDRATAIANAGLAQLDPSTTHGIGAVLGAGNITSITPLDTLYELIAHNRVVALKLNPITDPLLPALTKILAPFIAIGAVRILTGGAEVGTYLVRHEKVSHVHMTGSAATHDAIVFGTGPAGARRKTARKPVLDKDITSELGGVSPTIVLPGPWSGADIKYQAEHIATQRLHNGGYNCVATQVVLVSSTWAQRDEFVGALQEAFDRAPARAAYYPGSADRVAAAMSTYPEAHRLGADRGRVLIVSPDDVDPLLSTEYFAPVLGVVDLDGTDFVAQVADFANDRIVGTLGVNVIAHPDTISSLGPYFDGFLATLRYGTIAVNAWTGVGYLTAEATWGAYPGHTIDDVQSGIGIVHNARLIDKPERTVVRGPFRPAPRSLFHGESSISPKPPWFVSNRTARTTGRLLTEFAARPAIHRLVPIFVSALRG